MQFFGGVFVRPPGGKIKEHEAAERHASRGRESLDRGRNRNRRGVGDRIPIRARRDRWKCKGSESVLVGQPHRLPVTTGKRLGFAVLTTAIDWTDRVNDVLGAEPTAAGNDRLSGGQPSNLVHDLPALGENGWSSGVMNRTIDSAPAQKG